MFQNGTPLLIAILLVLGLSQGCQSGNGEQGEVVWLPLIFSVDDGRKIKTSICMKVRQKLYSPDQAPWSRFKGAARGSPEAELVAVIAALENQDETRLYELSHPRLGRDPKLFERQVRLMPVAKNIEIQIQKVLGYLRFDDLMFFIVKDTGSDYRTFEFARQEGGEVGFLPYGTEGPAFSGVQKIASTIVFDLVLSDWGSWKRATPVYCSEARNREATHRVVLADDPSSESAVELLLTGRSLAASDDVAPDAALRERISSLQEDLEARRLEEFLGGLTEGGSAFVGSMLREATEEEVRRYADSIVTLEPFFVLDADPLFIVYARTARHGVQGLYFLREEGDTFKWANSYSVMPLDGLLIGTFTKAAKEDVPFESWKIDGAGGAP